MRARGENAVAEYGAESGRAASPDDDVARLKAEVASLRARVTEAEEARQHAEDALDLIMTGPNEGIWEWDPCSKPLVLSARLLSILGFEGGTLHTTSHDWLDLVHPEDRDRYQHTLIRHLKGETPYFEAEYRVRSRDGDWRWVLARGIARQGPGGAYRMVGSVGDVTELRARADSLRESEARFRSLLQVAGSAILVLTPDMTITDFNTAAEQLLGRSAAEVLNRSLDRALPDLALDDLFMARFDTALCGIQPEAFEMPVSRPTRDGAGVETRIISWTVTRFLDARGLAAGVIATGQDVTNRHQAQQELEEAVAERTAALRQAIADLQEAKNLAELASRSKSEFLANMSHELRTPLNAVLGFSEMIAAELLGPLGVDRYRDYASSIHESARHLLQVINDILDVSKVEAGRFQLYPETIEAGEWLESCRRLLAERVEKADVRFRITHDPAVTTFQGDPLRLKQVVINLVSNALKATEAGHAVAVDLRPAEDGGVRLTVSDEGIGMTPEGIRTALEPFGQVDTQASRGRGGTGLGLPLARNLVELHGGRMDITSTPGVGTVITVTLPPTTPPQE